MASDSSSSSSENQNAQFETLLNFRDVGETVNKFTGQNVVKTGLLFRSARPDEATPSDRQLLKSTYSIRTVIDLRTKTEHIQALKKHKATQEARLSHVRSNDAVAEPLKIDGVRNLEIRLTGRAFEKHLTSQLSWSSYLKLAFLYIVGYRTEAISIIGREVMQPRGLVGLAVDTLDCSGAEIKEALESFLDPEGLPAMVHCTQGKDRTGIIVMLALMILGVPEDAIEHDYKLSDQGLVTEKESRLDEIRAIGLSDDFGGVAKDMMATVRGHLDTRYGGLEKYLDSIGFGDAEREKLRSRLTR